MLVSKKARYALRAVFELSKRWGQGPTKIADIASPQAIPRRFLEGILNQLKQGGFVDSRRGASGGYFLVRPPESLTVGEILRFCQGVSDPVECLGYGNRKDCPLWGDCVFISMWDEVRQAVSGVYDRTTFADLVERDRRRSHGRPAADYSI